MQLYGAKRYGSAITQGMLAIAGRRYAFIDVEGFDKPGAAQDRLRTVNPLLQVPTLVLDDGMVLTETAAITLYLADQVSGLAPAVGTPERIRFYRLLIWLVANVYPTFTYGDYPERWVPSAPHELDDATALHRERLYLWFEEQVAGPFVLGEEFCALDVYVAVMTAWRPRMDWFRQQTPKLAAVADRTRLLAPMAEVMKLNDW